MTTTEAMQEEQEAATVSLPAEVSKIGTLGSDPELIFASTGTPVARMRLVVERPKEPGNWAGERVSEWYDCTAFRSLGEHAAESLRKGDRVLVIGKPELRDWTDKDGTLHQSKGIIANAIGPDLRFATASVTRTKAKTNTTATISTSDFDEEPF